MLGNQQACRALYDKYKSQLFIICLRYALDRSQAQDFLQESFIKIFKNLDSYDGSKGAFEFWTGRITINVCLAYARKKTMYPVNLQSIEETISTDNSVLASLSLQDMLKVIQSLPYGYRTVFNLYVIDGFSHREIGQQLKISESTSKSQLAKARKLLQKKILINKKVRLENHG